ncbi:MAG: peptidase M23, partial [Phyllobacterium sp.]
MVDHKFAYLGFGSVVAAGVIAVSLGYLPGKPAAEKPASAAGVDAAAPAPQPAKPAPDAGGTA